MASGQKINTNIFLKKIIINKYSATDIFEFLLRIWMGHKLITNSGVGTLTPLEDLGLPDHIYKIIKGMWDTGFMMHLVKAIELIGGILLVFNIFIPLALIALIPIVINIYGIHIFLFDSYITSGLYMLLICLFLAFRHRESFQPLLKMK